MYDYLQVLNDKAEARGQNKIIELLNKLYSSGRDEDAKRALTDASYREALMKELAIQ